MLASLIVASKEQSSPAVGKTSVHSLTRQTGKATLYTARPRGGSWGVLVPKRGGRGPHLIVYKPRWSSAHYQNHH